MAATGGEGSDDPYIISPAVVPTVEKTDAGTTTFVDVVEPMVTGVDKPSMSLTRDFGGVPPDLKEFFERPVNIWAISTASAVGSLSPWGLWRGNAAVSRKLANFALYKGTMHLRFEAATTPYMYGRYNFFLDPTNCFGSSAAPYTYDTYMASNHGQYSCHLDFALNQPAHLVLPWMGRVVGVDNAAPSGYNEIAFSWVAAQQINDVTTNVTPTVVINIYAWVTDFEAAAPNPQSKESRGTKILRGVKDAQDSKVVSKTLNTIAGVANKVKDIPFIGGMASAVSAAASFGSSLASMFGFTRHIQDVASTYYRSDANIAASSSDDMTTTLTLDPKCARLLAPEMICGDGNDLLSFAFLLSRWSYLQQPIAWTTSQAVGTTLLTLGVTPCHAQQFSNAWYMTPLCHTSLAFSRWRGSMEYKIEVIASQYHRGRLRIFWSYGYTPAEPVNNTANIVYLDVVPGAVTTLLVPWGKNNPFLPTGLRDTTASPVVGADNGAITIQVDQVLLSVHAAAQVTIMVSNRGGPDFELSRPTTQTISTLHTAAYSSSAGLDVWPTITEYAQPTPGYIVPVTQQATEVQAPQTFGPLAEMVMGEGILSMRDLIKRYSLADVRGLENTATAGYICVDRIQRVPPVPKQATTAVMSWLGYVSMCYGLVTGGTRLRVTPGATTTTNPIFALSVGFNSVQFVIPSGAGLITERLTQRLLWKSGAGVSYPLISNATFPVVIPDQYGTLARGVVELMATTTSDTCVDYVRMATANGSTLIANAVYMAAGDDYNLMVYFGPPLLYTYAIPTVIHA